MGNPVSAFDVLLIPKAGTTLAAQIVGWLARGQVSQVLSRDVFAGDEQAR